MKRPSDPPLVALVGRPNVGKSTLFNRLAGRRLAITAGVPGVTRDRHLARCELARRPVLLIDTGGFFTAPADDLLAAALKQTRLAIEEADCVVLLADVRQGLTADDERLADLLRRAAKVTILAANKVDAPSVEPLAAEFYRLGLGEPLPLSAEHGLGLLDLALRIEERLLAAVGEWSAPDREGEDEPPPPDGGQTGPLRLAVIGRPNVGKSSLVNAILGEERVVVHPVPGTTRDPIDTEFVHSGRDFILIDTAGIRRRGKIADEVESFSVLRAEKSLARCDVAALVVDGSAGLTTQDQHIAAAAWTAGRGLVLVVNKWDLAAEPGGAARAELSREARDRLPLLSHVPLVFASALRRTNVERVLALAVQVYDAGCQRPPTKRLNEALYEAQIAQSAPRREGHRRASRIRYGAQTGVRPPRFLLFTNLAPGEDLAPAYLRFVESRVRAAFGFEGNPILLEVRGRPGKGRRGRRSTRRGATRPARDSA